MTAPETMAETWCDCIERTPEGPKWGMSTCCSLTCYRERALPRSDYAWTGGPVDAGRWGCSRGRRQRRGVIPALDIQPSPHGLGMPPDALCVESEALRFGSLRYCIDC